MRHRTVCVGLVSALVLFLVGSTHAHAQIAGGAIQGTVMDATGAALPGASVEVKNVDLPQEMQRAMAKQAEAERERRSKVIAAEGEFQASQRLADAAKILSDQPSALTLRYLQTLREIATENNSTTIFPVPIDLLKPFLGGGEKK